MFSAFLAIIFLATPITDHFIFQPPQAFVAPVRLMQFAVVIPLVVATLYASINNRLQRFSTPLAAATLVAVSLNSIYQRVLGHELDYFTAIGWANVAILGAFFFSGIRSVYVVPLGIVLFALNFAAELHVGDYKSQQSALINTVYELESMTVIFILGVAGCYIIEASTRLNWLESKEVQQQLEYDDLTGSLNRGQFRMVYRRLYSMAQREQRDISIAVVDIDFFKPYNDFYGHSRGDDCLAAIAQPLNQLADEHGGYCARLGGEEFVLLFYGMNKEEASALCVRACNTIERLGLPHESRPDALGSVTVSIGVYSLIPDGRVNRFAAMRIADGHLYRAKEQGRNQVVIDARARPGHA